MRARTLTNALRVAATVTVSLALAAVGAVRAAPVSAAPAAPDPAGSPVAPVAEPAAPIDTTGQEPGTRAIDEVAREAAARGTVRVIVGLQSRIVPEGGLPSERVDVQRQAIKAAQRRLLGELAGTGARVVRVFDSTPAVSLELPPDAVERLRASTVVASVTEEVPARPALAQSVPLVRADVTRAEGFGGAGRAVAILDTGVDTTHPFLAGRVVHEECYSVQADCPNGRTTMAGPGSGEPCTFQPDECDHGTHVAGIAAGRRTPGIPFDGVAPDASVVAMQIFSEFTGPLCFPDPEPCAIAWPTDQIAALERVLDLRDRFRIAAVNMSLGAFLFPSPCSLPPYDTVIAHLRSAGVATVVAAGNDAASSALSAPACVPGVVSVGSTTKADVVSGFSNSASFLSLLAPGSSITSSVPGGGTAAFNGTSMATPHVAGSFAVLRQSAPAAGVSTILRALQDTGVPVLDARNGLTKPRIDVAAARLALRPVLTPGAGTLVEGDRGSARLSIPVTLSAPSSVPVTATFRTVDVTAVANADYRSKEGTITFQPGKTSRVLKIAVRGDLLEEPDEAFLVAFEDPTEATLGGLFGLGVGVVVDDD
jgi:subtilisin family serine protease